MARTIKKIKNLKNSKKVWESKTIWVNILMGIGAVFSHFAELGIAYEKMVVGIALVNIVMRVFVKEEIEISVPEIKGLNNS